MIKADTSGALAFLNKNALDEIDAKAAFNTLPLYNGTGWLTLPADFNSELSDSIKTAAFKISGESEVFIVIGVGGSYLGARAALDYIKTPFYNALPKNTPDILFAGNNLSGEYLSHILELIGGRDFSVNIVSKSGSTLEPAVALRVFRDKLISRYGGIKDRLYVTTDKKKSPLLDMAEQEGCTVFTMPGDVGGRYSVLTAVGLLPCAVAGIDINAVMSGAQEEMESGLEEALLYAKVRQALYRSGKKIELLACFEPAFRYTGEWWKQLFGESEGKNGFGIFPAFADYTADLHSLGQYVQDGERTIFETFVTFTQPRVKISVPHGMQNDSIATLAGMDFGDLNRAAHDAVKQAHIDGGIPVTQLLVPGMTDTSFGALVYFLERACAISAIISGVDPFNQPGVEAYKKNLYGILNL